MSQGDVYIFVFNTLGSQLLMMASDLSCQWIEYHKGLKTVKDECDECAGERRDPRRLEEMTQGSGSSTPQPTASPAAGEAPEQSDVARALRDGRRPCAVDCRRLWTFTAVTTVSGFLFQGWWYYMAYAVPGTAWTPVLQKTFYTQLFDTIVIPCEQAALAWLTPGVSVAEKLRRDVLPLQAVAWAFLPGCHIVQFMFVPLHWQIWVSRMNGYVMGVSLSFFAFRAVDTRDDALVDALLDEDGEKKAESEGAALESDGGELPEPPPLPASGESKQRDVCGACAVM